MLNDNKENFLLIDLGTLLNEKLLGFNLYILHDNNFVLYRGAEVNFTEKHRQNIIAKKLNLYIEKKEKEKYIGYLKQNLKNIVDDKNINNKEKSKYYYQASRTVLAQLFSESEEVSNTKASAEILSDTAITILTASDFEMKNILENLQFEYTTFTHSLNVALIATIFAQSLGMKNEKLQSITTGALLHDIGKKEIDPKILFKPGKLEPEEWELVKTHPVIGYNIVKTFNYDDKTIYNIVLYHHEKINGKGYPEGIKDIPIEAQVAALCDIFDALTSQRCYKNALGSFPAFKIMFNEMGDALNRDLLAEFIKLFKDYGN